MDIFILLFRHVSPHRLTRIPIVTNNFIWILIYLCTLYGAKRILGSKASFPKGIMCFSNVNKIKSFHFKIERVAWRKFSLSPRFNPTGFPFIRKIHKKISVHHHLHTNCYGLTGVILAQYIKKQKTKYTENIPKTLNIIRHILLI